MVIAGLGTAAPGRRYSQRECWEALQEAERFHALNPRSKAILKQVLTHENGISARHLALGSLSEAFHLTPNALQARFLAHAPLLATQAAAAALQERFGLSNGEVRWSAGVLHEFGNLSSASIYFVLEAALRQRAPRGYWWVGTFGAGFSGHGAILEVQ